MILDKMLGKYLKIFFLPLLGVRMFIVYLEVSFSFHDFTLWYSIYENVQPIVYFLGSLIVLALYSLLLTPFVDFPLAAFLTFKMKGKTKKRLFNSFLVGFLALIVSFGLTYFIYISLSIGLSHIFGLSNSNFQDSSL